MTINLSNGYQVLIDEIDFNLIGNKSWFAQGNKKRSYFYAASAFCINGKWKIIYLHRIIMNAQKGEFVDHINGDTLDCRRNNLRLCNRSQNNYNQRKIKGIVPFKGVTINKKCSINKFCARIRIINENGEKKRIRLGFFLTAEIAAEAFDKAALKYHGEFAFLNFPKKIEQYKKELNNK